MTASILTGLWAGYAVAIPVGALAVLLLDLTARTSFRVGASGALGVATADGLYALAGVLGGAALAHAVQPASGPLRWLAAVILVGVAAKIAIVAVRGRRRSAAAEARAGLLDRPIRAYLSLLGLTLLNPWTLVFFAVLVLGGKTGVGGVAAQVAFVVAVFAASASWQLFLAAGGAVLGRTLTGPRGRLTTALISSVVITALAVFMIAESNDDLEPSHNLDLRVMS